MKLKIFIALALLSPLLLAEDSEPETVPPEPKLTLEAIRRARGQSRQSPDVVTIIKPLNTLSSHNYGIERLTTGSGSYIIVHTTTGGVSVVKE